jgi:hypothetical protein
MTHSGLLAEYVPTEVLQHILLFVPTRYFIGIATVHSSWRELFEPNSTLWTYLCERDFPLQNISSEYRNEYISYYGPRFVTFPGTEKNVIILSKEGKTAMFAEQTGITASVFLKKQIYITENTTCSHQYRFHTNTVKDAGYFIGFFIDRGATISNAPKVDGLYRKYLGYNTDTMSHGFNDHGYIWQQGSHGTQIPMDRNRFFKSGSEVILTLNFSGNVLEAICQSSDVTAKMSNIAIIKGDVIYVGATLCYPNDTITVLKSDYK